VFVVGVGVGLLAAKILMAPDSCCTRVASGVRDKVGEKLGSTAQGIGDLFGVWQYTPGLLDLFGVK
jgi:hypothetical protein